MTLVAPRRSRSWTAPGRLCPARYPQTSPHGRMRVLQSATGTGPDLASNCCQVAGNLAEDGVSGAEREARVIHGVVTLAWRVLPDSRGALPGSRCTSFRIAAAASIRTIATGTSLLMPSLEAGIREGPSEHAACRPRRRSCGASRSLRAGLAVLAVSPGRPVWLHARRRSALPTGGGLAHQSHRAGFGSIADVIFPSAAGAISCEPATASPTAAAPRPHRATAVMNTTRLRILVPPLDPPAQGCASVSFVSKFVHGRSGLNRYLSSRPLEPESPQRAGATRL